MLWHLTLCRDTRLMPWHLTLNTYNAVTQTHCTVLICSYLGTLLYFPQQRIIASISSYAQFSLPELTARVDGWPVSKHGPSTRLVETRARQLGPVTRQLGPLTRAVNSGSGNRALDQLTVGFDVCRMSTSSMLTAAVSTTNNTAEYVDFVSLRWSWLVVLNVCRLVKHVIYDHLSLAFSVCTE